MYSYKLLFALTLQTVWLTSTHGGSCDDIFLPSMSEPVLTIPEHSLVKIPFEFAKKECAVRNDVIITLARKTTDRKIPTLYCRILQINGTCHVPSGEYGCSCSQKTGEFVFKKNVTRADSITWIWRTDAGTKETAITLNVIYPSRILKLTFSPQNSEPVSQDMIVDVVCFWENGNPPVTALLLDRHGVEMEDSIYSSGQIRYRFPAVGCQDAGLIRCEAPGASQNKTATLVVRCAPEFINVTTAEISLIPNQDLQLNFDVRAHSTKFHTCRLIKAVPEQPSREYPQYYSVSFTSKGALTVDCAGIINLSGTPPDLTLTVRLDNVRKEEEGQWRLELTNDAGSGHVDFSLHLQMSLSTEGLTGNEVTTLLEVSTDPYFPPVTSSSSGGANLISIVGGVAAVALLVAITAIFVVVIFVRRGMRAIPISTPRPEESIELQMPFQRVQDPQRECMDQDSNYYWEISDESVSSTPEEEPPQPCQRAKQLPDDYLHPSALPDSAELN